MNSFEDELNQSFQEFEKTCSQVKRDYKDLIDRNYTINSKLNKNIENFENSLKKIKEDLKYFSSGLNNAEITKISKKVPEMEEEMKPIIEKIKERIGQFGDNSEIKNLIKESAYSSPSLDNLQKNKGTVEQRGNQMENLRKNKPSVNNSVENAGNNYAKNNEIIKNFLEYPLNIISWLALICKKEGKASSNSSKKCEDKNKKDNRSSKSDNNKGLKIFCCCCLAILIVAIIGILIYTK